MSALETINRIIRSRAIENMSIEVLEVSPKLYAQLLQELKGVNNFLIDPKPRPPRRSYTTEENLLGWSRSETFDHHAPEYLRELEAWRGRQALNNGMTKLIINSAFGPTEIRMA